MPSSAPWPFPDKLRLSWKAGAVLLRLTSVFIATRLLSKSPPSRFSHGAGAKVVSRNITEWTQKVQVKNAHILVKAVMDRPKGKPLVTVCNHISYLDDTSFYRMSHTLYIKIVSLFRRQYNQVKNK